MAQHLGPDSLSMWRPVPTELHLFSHPKTLEDPQTFSAIPNFRELTFQDLGVVFWKSPFWGFRWKSWDLPHLFLPSWERLGISTNGCMHPQSLQSCPTLCDPVDCSPPGSSVHRIIQSRMLEWVAMPSSRQSSWPRDWTHVSYISCTDWQVLYP